MPVKSHAADVGSPVKAVPGWVYASAALMALALGALTILRHEFYLSTSWDLGFYIQDIYQIAHGHWTNSLFSFNVFADHFSPILILLAPLGWFHPAEGLLALQAVVVGSGVVAAYRLGDVVSGHRIATLCAIWFGLSVTVWHTMLYDFRPANLGAIALLWLIVELELQRRGWLIMVLTVLAASSREDVAVFAGIAILISAMGKKSRGLLLLGTGSAAVGIAYATIGWRLFAPFQYMMWYRFADYGDGPLSAIMNPGYAIPTAFSRLARPDPLVAMLVLLLPTLVIAPLLGWRYSWPGFLVILSNAVSVDPFIPSMYYQYYILAAVFIIWGAAHGFRRPSLEARSSLAISAAALVWLVFGPLGLVFKPPLGRSLVDIVGGESRATMGADLALPADASVSAGLYVLPHLASRDRIYSFPSPLLCSPTLLGYQPHTSHPSVIVIEPEDRVAVDVDPATYGYRLRVNGDLEVWAKTSSTDEHPTRTCPSPEDARRGTFARVEHLAGS